MEIKEIVKELKKKMQCNCDLDAWQPERSTGHSWVCRIHQEAKRIEAGVDFITDTRLGGE